VLAPGWVTRGSGTVFYQNDALGATCYDLFVAAEGQGLDSAYWWSCASQEYVEAAQVPLDDGTGKKMLKVMSDGTPFPGQIPEVIKAKRAPAFFGFGEVAAPGPASKPAPVRAAASAPAAAPVVMTPAPNDGNVVLGDRPAPRLPLPWYEKARDDDFVVFENRETGAKTSELWGEEPPLPGGGGGQTWWSFRRRERYDESPRYSYRVVLVNIPAPPPKRDSRFMGAGASVKVKVATATATPVGVTWKEKAAAKAAAAAAAAAAKAAPTPVVADKPHPPMPLGWLAADTEDGSVYFYREDTGVSVWALWLALPEGGFVNCGTWEEVAERPDIADDDESSAVVDPNGTREPRGGAGSGPAAVQEQEVAAEPAAAVLAEGWAAVVDDESGSTFYYNASTGETQWDFPAA
jgi:hypothetical protein